MRKLFKKRQDRLPFFLLTLFIIFIINLHIYWIVINNAPPIEDDIMHLCKSLHTQKNASASLAAFINNIIAGGYDDVYPHTVYSVSFFFFYFLGISEKVARLSILPFLCLIVYSTYFLGKELWGTWAGFTASLCCASAFTVQKYSHAYLLDIPLTAAFTLHALALLKARFFTSRKGSIFWGLSFALGFLIKETFLLWILIPESIFLFKWIKNEKKLIVKKIILLHYGLAIAFIPYLVIYFFTFNQDMNDLLVLRNWAATVLYLIIILSYSIKICQNHYSYLANPMIGIAAALIILAPWYSINAVSLTINFASALNTMQTYSPQPAYEFNKLFELLTINFPLLFPLLAATIITIFIIRKNHKYELLNKYIFNITLLSGIALHYSLNYGWPDRGRFLPGIPALSIFLFAWISYALKKHSWCMTILFAPIYIQNSIYWIPQLQNKQLIFMNNINISSLNEYYNPPPQPQCYGIVSIICDIIKDAKAHNQDARIWAMSTDETKFIQTRLIKYYILLYNLPVSIINVEQREFNTEANILRNIRDNGNYFLSIWEEENSNTIQTQAVLLQGWRLQCMHNYRILDKGNITVYRRINKKALPASSAQPGN
ncbi:MAG: glycosyltransferase family 39 protein [bacterium]|nr:glycosyltransferase family 39 protein [bacterium]